MTRLAHSSRLISLAAGRPRNPWALACGLTMIALGVTIAVMPTASRAEAASLLGYALAVAGSLELLAALSGIGRGPRASVAADALLGATSFGGAFLLLWGVPAAASAATAVMIWLIARGVIDLLAPAAMPSELLQDGRLIRAGVDLTLGLLTLVALTIIPWWTYSSAGPAPPWPQSSFSPPPASPRPAFTSWRLRGSGLRANRPVRPRP